jgi:hypothetical protein
MLGHLRFAGADMYARKAIADPDLVSHSWVHHFEAPGNVGGNWQETTISADDPWIKFNHYAFMSQEDARRKSAANRNPFMNFSEEVDEFFSREVDTEIQYYLPELKERLLNLTREFPPAHPDDWVPPAVNATA